MQVILRKPALVLLGWLQHVVDPELSERINAYREQARRLEATNAGAKKEITRLEREFGELKSQRDELNGEIALLELQTEQADRG
jgi:chromosome segregation ATPase